MRTPTRAAATLLAALSITTLGCTPTAPADPAACPTAGAGQFRAAVVVDAHTLPGGEATPSVVCVVLDTGATGLDALTARAARLGRSAPRVGASGLVCGIDDAPAPPDCGVLGPDGYQYWGYYVGGSSWGYAMAGPASRVLTDGAVEGWSFQNGSDGDVPATSASFAALTH